jgi:hypothetical protein
MLDLLVQHFYCTLLHQARNIFLLWIIPVFATIFLILISCNSETVKFGHVTFFWNGNRSGYIDESKEEYVEITSDNGITFNVKQKMKVVEIAEKGRDAILSGKFDQVNNFEIWRMNFLFAHCLVYYS